jgi:hypothetical protein
MIIQRIERRNCIGIRQSLLHINKEEIECNHLLEAKVIQAFQTGIKPWIHDVIVKLMLI